MGGLDDGGMEQRRSALELHASVTVTVMPSKPSSAAATTAHSFNKILNQYRSSSKQRSASDIEEAVRKLRRLILVDTIPSDVVSTFVVQFTCYTTIISISCEGSHSPTTNLEDTATC